MRKCLPIIAAGLAFAATALAQSPPKTQPSPGLIASARAPLPQRESDYIAIIDKAQKQYAANRSVDARRNTRANLQIAVHDFMGLAHNAQDWVGVFKDSKQTHEGALTLEIEIAPGVTIATWDNAAMDVSYNTLLKPYMPVGKVAGSLAIGDTVVFSANLIGAVISSDDDMVLHPQVIGQFSKLQKLDDTAPQK
jgi:hypothetical protein